ncbi:glycosyltransferase family 4 protein [Lacibacterium aquatile]|uniref:Glycosyltransferase family 4 protein n=1 Tax=Lacibacterium aquatile TaxID=1168082 RepID=A0ABW5DYQ9_9PROT
MSNPRKQVLLVQHRLFQYRVPLFERMRELAEDRNIDLRVIHGQPTDAELVRKDQGHLDWADQVRNRYISLGGSDLVWQPLPQELANPDLCVILQLNRVISNYPWLLRRKFGRTKVGYWGHGANLQAEDSDSLRERWKRALSHQVDHWFAYTDATVDLLVGSGYPANQITALNNAIDTNGFRAQCDAVTVEEIADLRTELRVPDGGHLGIFCGSLYAEKRLDLLLEAGDILAERFPGFTVAVVGDGPGRAMLDAAAKPWMRTVGVKFGAEKARYFRAGSVMLNPGLVGLHILDSFCAGLPMVSTRNAKHSPEIAYLRDGENGILAGDGAEAYAEAVARLLADGEFRQRLAAQARADGRAYTIEAMADNFMGGIDRCLAA